MTEATQLAHCAQVPTSLTRGELNLAIEKPTGRWRPLIVTANFTGMRASNCAVCRGAMSISKPVSSTSRSGRMPGARSDHPNRKRANVTFPRPDCRKRSRAMERAMPQRAARSRLPQWKRQRRKPDQCLVAILDTPPDRLWDGRGNRQQGRPEKSDP